MCRRNHEEAANCPHPPRGVERWRGRHGAVGGCTIQQKETHAQGHGRGGGIEPHGSTSAELEAEPSDDDNADAEQHWPQKLRGELGLRHPAEPLERTAAEQQQRA